MYNPYDLSLEEIYPDADDKCNGMGHNFNLRNIWKNDANETIRETIQCMYCLAFHPDEPEFDEELWWMTKD
jgi:hypothetical protein